MPGILDKSIDLAHTLRKPPLIQLLIDRDILLIQKDMAQRAIARRKIEVQLRQQLFQALLSETILLNDILRKRDEITRDYQSLSPANPNLKNPLALPTIEAVGSQTTNRWRVALQEALLEYTETLRVSQYRATVAGYSLIHLAYQQANDAREGAAQTWNSLLAEPINQLAQYHAGGVRPEQIADILSKFFIGSAILAK